MTQTLSAPAHSTERRRASSRAPGSGPPIRRVSRRHQALLVLADAGLAEAFFLTATYVAAGVGIHGHSASAGPWPIVLAILFPLVVATRGLYRLSRFPSWRGQAAAGMRAVVWSVAIGICALFLFAREIPVALRLVLVFYHAMLAVWMVAVRPILTVLLDRALAPETPRQRALFLGSDWSTLQLARSMLRRSDRPEILGFMDLDMPQSGPLHPFFRVEPDEIPGLALDLGADLVVLARPDLPREQVVRLGDQLSSVGIRVSVACNAFNKLVDSMPFETLGGVLVMPLGHAPPTVWRQRLKRVFDLAACIVGGIAVLPGILVIALVVRLSSPGPVLFRQIRIGRDGRPFVFYKFRSMRSGSDDTEYRRYIEDLMTKGGAAATDSMGRRVYKLVDDSRITPIGRFLRRTSLDELPQLLNVLRGEMSLIGPRPCLPFEFDLYQDWQKRRLSVTPGMTGLWQVTGRSFVTFEDMVLMDLFYISNWSFLMDLKLLFRTVPVVIWGKGGL